MTTISILLLLLSLFIASGLSFFQYFYKAKTKSKTQLVLVFLRFLSIFGILLLLINPIFSTKKLETTKTQLPIVIDNSCSIVELKAQVVALQLFEKLNQNKELQAKFDIQTYQFDSNLELSNRFIFSGKQSNIDEVARSLKSIYKNTNFPTVLITDGNQTTGTDYIYSFDNANAVFPIVLGDTTKVLDLKINQLNVNKYAFQKNKFPVEVFLNYSGNKTIKADFRVSQGNLVLSKQSVTFSPSNKSAIVNILIPADKVGVQIFKATVSSNQKEKNTYNNTKNFAVEIINQKTNIAIISSISHPDIGALKRSIEANVQRKVTLVNPANIGSIDGYNVVVLYQPTTEFKMVFDKLKQVGTNTFIITGNQTDFNFLNQQQSNLVFKMSNQSEDYLAEFNTQFNLFDIDNFGFDSFPPLQNPFGTITTNGNVSTLLFSKIRKIDTKSPLLAFAENQGKRAAFLLGENSWKYRMQNRIDKQTYEKYDVFIDKIIQFLASNDAKKSLVVNHESFYNSGEAIEISAQYFNRNYEFDEKASLSISVKNTKTKQNKNYDLLKGNNVFKVNLDGLAAGAYDFTVKELNSKTSYSSHFEILDFEIEKQFVNPDIEKLKQLATQTSAKLYYPDQVDDLIKSLLNKEIYKAVQKEIETKTPLIDWFWLLVLIIASLGTEWFLRKYNGML